MRRAVVCKVAGGAVLRLLIHWDTDPKASLLDMKEAAGQSLTQTLGFT